MTAAAPATTATEEAAPSLPKAAVEAVARALYALTPWRKNTYGKNTYGKNTYGEDTFAWEELTDGDRESFREEAEVALTDAAPIIAAQAKAEALREAADALNTEAVGFQNGWSSCPTDVGKLDGIAQTRDWLCARAASIESESP